jgi:hypothetical protein
MRPFARLRSAKGRVYSQAAKFIGRISDAEQHQRGTVKDELQHRRKRRRKERMGVKALKQFYDDATILAIFIAPTYGVGETRRRLRTDARTDQERIAQRTGSQQEGRSQAPDRLCDQDG